MAHKPGDNESLHCEREPELLRALAAGELPPDLLQHTHACPVCAEVRSVAHELRRLDEACAEEPLQSAASMWWRLNLRMRRRQVNRAQLPLLWMGRICAVTLLITTVFVLWHTSRQTAASSVLVVGIVALAAVALPAMLVLWRWSRS